MSHVSSVKIAVSIQEKIFRSAEKLAGRLGVSRTEFYTKALVNLLEKYRDDLITGQLNQIYGPGGVGASLDRKTASLQSRSLLRGRW